MADGESQTLFMTITGCDAPKAVQYLQFADGTVEAALELYYANNGADLATGGAAASSSRQVIDVDDDPDVEQDSAFAQRMQNDLYQDGGDASDMGLGADRVRAPMARTTETLVGPGADTGESDEDRRTQMLARLARGPNRRREFETGLSDLDGETFH